MPSLVFESCCCCISVRTGSFVIGYLQLVVEIIFAIGALLFLVLGGVAAAESKHSKDPLEQNFGLALIILGVLFLIFVAVLLAFTIALLVGLHQNKRGPVKAFLIYYAIFICIFVVLFIFSLFKAFQIGATVASILEILLQIYFLLVIRSHYYKMDETNKGVIYRAS